ncbi:MAG TPA: hypothetical protein VKP30_07585, partial [Polyangiaceae bacterium]|nr:hypothetical protein [Polyangiaceae bacterium]
MSNYRQSLSLVSTGLGLLLGCGGRSDMTDYYSELGSFAGTSTPHSGGSASSNGGTSARGGSTARGGQIAQGGAPAYGGNFVMGGAYPKGGASWFGGAPAQGGVQWRGGGFGGILPFSGSPAVGGAILAGGTTSTTKIIPGDCCVAHDTPGCQSAAAETCVCGRDALCCLVAWDAVCVSQMFARGCDSCSVGGAANGGAANGGSVAFGGTWSRGGAVNGGAVNGGAVNGGSFAFGGSVSNGGMATGGVLVGGSGGTAPATGGVVNTGGTAPSTTAPPALQAVIDDLEDGDGDLIQVGGRDGYWFTLNDGTTTGLQEPVWGSRIRSAYRIMDRGGSQYAAWTQGSGFTTWGAGFGLYLRTSARFYNAKRYQGITFWARVTPG